MSSFLTVLSWGNLWLKKDATLVEFQVTPGVTLSNVILLNIS